MVESEADKGAGVWQVTPNDLVETYEQRAVLESYAAEKGACSLKGNGQALRKRYLAILAHPQKQSCRLRLQRTRNRARSRMPDLRPEAISARSLRQTVEGRRRLHSRGSCVPLRY